MPIRVSLEKSFNNFCCINFHIFSMQMKSKCTFSCPLFYDFFCVTVTTRTQSPSIIFTPPHSYSIHVHSNFILPLFFSAAFVLPHISSDKKGLIKVRAPSHMYAIIKRYSAMKHYAKREKSILSCK